MICIWSSWCHCLLPSLASTTTTVLRLYGFCPGQPVWAGTRRNIHPLTPIVVINHPLSVSSIYYDPWHPRCSVYMPDSLFAQSLSNKFSLVYLSAWHPPLHTPYICSTSHCLLFAVHAHTIATCFAVVLRLCHLILVSLSTLYLELYLVVHSHLCLLKCHLIFLSYEPGLSSMQHATLHTTAVQSPSHYQWYILVGKQWYQLPIISCFIRVLNGSAFQIPDYPGFPGKEAIKWV